MFVMQQNISVSFGSQSTFCNNSVSPNQNVMTLFCGIFIYFILCWKRSLIFFFFTLAKIWLNKDSQPILVCTYNYIFAYVIYFKFIIDALMGWELMQSEYHKISLSTSTLILPYSDWIISKHVDWELPKIEKLIFAIVLIQIWYLFMDILI